MRKGAVIGFAAYVLWGLLTVYWKALHHFDPFELIGYRVVGSGVLLVGFLAWKGRFRPLLDDMRDRHAVRPGRARRGAAHPELDRRTCGR